MVAQSVMLLRAEEAIERANETRYQSRALADELRQSSDDLTRMLRAYVTTNNPLFKRHYEEILAVRDGRAPRPADADNVYWDLVLDDDVRPRPSGPAIPLLELMRKAGFTPAEFARLERARIASDALRQREREAMALIESVDGGAPATDATRIRAISMLQDSAYRETKARIMRPIAEFHVLVNDRTLAAIGAARNRATRWRVLLVTTSGLLLLALAWLLRAIMADKSARSAEDALFRAVFDNAAVGLIQLSADGRVVNVNRAYCDILGYSQSEVLTADLHLCRLTAHDGRPAESAASEKPLEVAEASRSWTQRCVHKLGHSVWLDVSTSAVPNGTGEPGLIAAVVDVSKRVRAEDELERHGDNLERLVNDRTAQLEKANAELQREIAARVESETTFRFIADSVCDVIWIADAHTNRFTYVSPSILQQRGYTTEEFLARSLDSLHTSRSTERLGDVLLEAKARWNAGDKVRTLSLPDLELVHRDGRTIQAEVLMSVHEDEDGNPGTIVGVTRDVTERKREEETIRRLAHYDGLTELPNRRLLLDRLNQAMARAKRDGSHIGLLFVDLDHFKPVNDAFGHEVGDWLLRSVAIRMADCLRGYDTAARIGGDEFIVLLPGLDCVEDALRVGERVRAALDRPFVTPDDRVVNISSSIGVAGYPDHAETERDLLRVGDEAMFRAKNAGGNRVEVLPVDDLKRRLSLDPISFSPETLLHLTWKPSYESGHQQIDRDHRELFRAANRLFTNLTRREAESADFAAAFDKLITQIGEHFEHEEAILRQRCFASVDEHAALHRELLERAAELKRRVSLKEVVIGELIQFVTVDVVAKHMLEADRAFFELVASPRAAVA